MSIMNKIYVIRPNIPKFVSANRKPLSQRTPSYLYPNPKRNLFELIYTVIVLDHTVNLPLEDDSRELLNNPKSLSTKKDCIIGFEYANKSNTIIVVSKIIILVFVIFWKNQIININSSAIFVILVYDNILFNTLKISKEKERPFR